MSLSARLGDWATPTLIALSRLEAMGHKNLSVQSHEVLKLFLAQFGWQTCNCFCPKT